MSADGMIENSEKSIIPIPGTERVLKEALGRPKDELKVEKPIPPFTEDIVEGEFTEIPEIKTTSIHGATPKGPEQPNPESSWLIKDEEDKKVLDSIKNDSLKRRIMRLHEAAKTPGLLERKDWTQEYLKLMHDAEDEKFKDDQDAIDVFLLNINKGIQAMDEKHSEKVVREINTEVQKVQVMENIPKPEQETPEGWTVFILTNLDLAEKESERKLLRTNEEDDNNWKLIDKAMAAIPEKLGEDYVPRDPDALDFFEARHPEGFYLKERLQLYVDARRHINDRYIEISRANGSLTAMGLGKDEVPFEGISYKLQVVNNEDWWAIYHGDELFPELSETKELAPNVSKASEKWMEVGIAYRTLPQELLTTGERSILDEVFKNKDKFDDYYSREDKDKQKKRSLKENQLWPSTEDIYKVLGRTITPSQLQIYANIPTFENSRNVSEYLAGIRARLRKNLSDKKSEQLAERVLSVWLTIPLMDRNRSGSQGNNEDRDLMWSERKRVYELGDKEREPGMDWTVGRYFVSSPDQGSAIKLDDDAKKSKKLKHRKETLSINAERGILIEKDQYFEGEVVSDFLHNNFFAVRDELLPGKGIRRNMASYIINADGTIRENGFKNIPYLRMGQASYTGYFGYTLGKAKQINADLTGLSWKDPKEMAIDDFWNKKRDLIERMEHVSPRFIIREFQARGTIIRNILAKDSGFNPGDIAKIAGYSDNRDLVVITDDDLREKARRIILKNAEIIAKSAKERADIFWRTQSAKIRMVHAMGQVWTGSLDGIQETSNIITQSTIPPDVMRSIINAIEVSRYLEGEYLDQFKYEIWQEMGFGTKWGSGTKKRYRNKIEANWWD